MVLEYFDSNNSLIPINNLNGISRYASSDNELVKLSKLGTNSWEKKNYLQKKQSKIQLLNYLNYMLRGSLKNQKYIKLTMTPLMNLFYF